MPVSKNNFIQHYLKYTGSPILKLILLYNDHYVRISTTIN